MAFYKSKYTGAEIDQRLAQGTYDDALMRGFDGAKEDFDILLAKLKKISDLAYGSQQYEDNRLDTVNKTVVGAINELHTELQSKPNKDEVVEQAELQVFKDEIAAKYTTKGELKEESISLNSKITTVNNNLVESVNTINENVNNGFIAINEAIKQNAETLVAEITERKEAMTEEATIREESDKELSNKINTVNNNLVTSINNEIRPAIEKNTKDIEVVNDTLTQKIEETEEKLQADINYLKPRITTLESLQIVKVNPDSENYSASYELQDATGKVYGQRINIATDKFIKSVSYADQVLTIVFVLEDGSESTQTIDMTELMNIYTAGGGITISETGVISVSDETLQMIQYADSEVRRLETAKIPYAYDEKTQSNINIILPEGGSYIGNYGDENATVAKAAVYDGIKQLEIGSSKVHTNINTDSDVTIETSDGKKVIATTDQIPDVFETKGLTELETGESSANIEAALGIDFASLIEIIRENKTIIVDRNSAGDYKACVHASGNISSGNGAANLMFFIGTTPTIYQIQYVSGTFALAVDEYPFAKKSDISNLATKDEIPDVSELATKEELVNKVDWIDYNNTKNIILPSNGQVFGDFGGEESNSSLLGARIYNAGLENEEKQVEVGTSKVHLNLNSLDKPTIETPDGKENLVVESDIELIPIEVNFPVRTSGGSDGPEDRVYTQEEILEWFGVANIAALKTQIANKGIQYIKYGIMLMGNPYYYRMPVQYAAFESANQIKLVFIGLNTNNDVASKYEIIINLDGTIIEGNSNVKVTITSIESGDVDLSKYQTITDNSLATSAKTIPAAINEIKESVDSISDPYEINLTNLLSAEDSESISTIIGGIDNLNNTVQDNRIIVGTISNGNVSVSIRILGNVTTLYYLLDSVVGLTLNEIAITNTSGTLSKKVTTHSVITENMVINSLESNETTLPLSAAQGKVLSTDKQNKTDNNLSTTNKTVVGAINELLTKVQELETKNTELESRLAALEGTN